MLPRCWRRRGGHRFLREFDAAEKEFEAVLNIDPSHQRALQFRKENLRRMKGGSR